MPHWSQLNLRGMVGGENRTTSTEWVGRLELVELAKPSPLSPSKLSPSKRPNSLTVIPKLNLPLLSRYDVELYQRIEHLIGKKLPLYHTVEEEVLSLKERVCEAQRYARMVCGVGEVAGRVWLLNLLLLPCVPVGNEQRC